MKSMFAFLDKYLKN